MNNKFYYVFFPNAKVPHPGIYLNHGIDHHNDIHVMNKKAIIQINLNKKLKVNCGDMVFVVVNNNNLIIDIFQNECEIDKEYMNNYYIYSTDVNLNATEAFER